MSRKFLLMLVAFGLMSNITEATVTTENVLKENRQPVPIENCVNEINRVYSDALNRVKTIEYNNWLATKTDSPSYDYYNVGVVSNASPKALDSILSGTNLSSLRDVFINAEETYQINALILIGIIGQESCYGSSKRAIQTNNLWGCNVIEYSDEGKCFNSYEDSILSLAWTLRNEYANQGLSSLGQIGEKYAADENWSRRVNLCVKDCLRKL